MPGKLRYVADTMSRAYITGDAGCGAPEDMNMLVHSLVENLPATGINEWITKTIKKMLHCTTLIVRNEHFN